MPLQGKNPCGVLSETCCVLLQATMLLHWSPFSDEPVRLSQEAIKAMTSDQMQVTCTALNLHLVCTSGRLRVSGRDCALHASLSRCVRCTAFSVMMAGTHAAHSMPAVDKGAPLSSSGEQEAAISMGRSCARSLPDACACCCRL